MNITPPHRVVIDPNVFVSAVITPAGALGPLLSAIDDGIVLPVVTPHLVDEVVDVLARPKLSRYVERGAGAAFEQRMKLMAEWHPDSTHPPSVCRDPEDDYLIALALTARAEAVTTGDGDLQAVGDVGVDILTPRQLLTRLGL